MGVSDLLGSVYFSGPRSGEVLIFRDENFDEAGNIPHQDFFYYATALVLVFKGSRTNDHWYKCSVDRNQNFRGFTATRSLICTCSKAITNTV